MLVAAAFFSPIKQHKRVQIDLFKICVVKDLPSIWECVWKIPPCHRRSGEHRPQTCTNLMNLRLFSMNIGRHLDRLRNGANKKKKNQIKSNLWKYIAFQRNGMSSDWIYIRCILFFFFCYIIGFMCRSKAIYRRQMEFLMNNWKFSASNTLYISRGVQHQRQDR